MTLRFKQISGTWLFFIFMVTLYFLLFFVNPNLCISSLIFFRKILIKIIPIFLFVWFLMVIANYFITPKFVFKYFDKKGANKWLFAIIGGILSEGPIYVWYPLLADLKEKGFGYGFVACFLYNRAIKLPVLPAAIYYFGWKYILILALIMIIASISQGVIINKLIKEKL
jgi:uncharacterized membrane protein YraQ (UPF0718 family)